VREEASAVEQLSSQLILALSGFKNRSRKKDASKERDQSVSSPYTTNALLNAFLITQLRQVS
jgi:hypothetical protein